MLMSFSLGANQGQGAPAKMESKGLAKELVDPTSSDLSFTKQFQAYSSIVVPSRSNFSGILPHPVDHPISELGVASFMHTTVDRIEQKLIAVIAARIERGRQYWLFFIPCFAN